jgi:ribosome-associated protein
MTEAEAALGWALLAARIGAERKAQNVVVLDMREVTLVADYFVILSGHTPLQVGALADHIEEGLVQVGAERLRRVGGARGHWILLDFGSVVVHVFTEEERRYYDLERLWGDARPVAWEAAASPS